MLVAGLSLEIILLLQIVIVESFHTIIVGSSYALPSLTDDLNNIYQKYK